MDFDWKNIIKKGHDAKGYVEVFFTLAKSLPIQVVINYHPQFINGGDQRTVNVSCFIESSKLDITDGLLHWIYDDIFELVKANEENYFKKGGHKIEYLNTQTFIVNKIPTLELFSHGDYSDCTQSSNP